VSRALAEDGLKGGGEKEGKRESEGQKKHSRTDTGGWAIQRQYSSDTPAILHGGDIRCWGWLPLILVNIIVLVNIGICLICYCTTTTVKAITYPLPTLKLSQLLSYCLW